MDKGSVLMAAVTAKKLVERSFCGPREVNHLRTILAVLRGGGSPEEERFLSLALSNIRYKDASPTTKRTLLGNILQGLLDDLVPVSLEEEQFLLLFLEALAEELPQHPSVR